MTWVTDEVIEREYGLSNGKLRGKIDRQEYLPGVHYIITDLELVKVGNYRIISNRRARILRKRGEFLKWSRELNSYIWEPDWHTWNRETESGLPWIDHKEYLRQMGLR